MAESARSISPNPRKQKTIRFSDAQLRAAIRKAAAKFATRPELDKPVVLTGLMGVGKTAVGQRLARVLKVKFIDSDQEIERAAGLKVRDIFAKYGEPHFRDRERAIIERLLDETNGVIALGGGAFVDDETRALILQQGLAVWLKAPLDVLVERTGRRNTRPLLESGDPKAILKDLLESREGAYAQAHVHCNSGLGRLDRTVLSLLNRANKFYFGAPTYPSKRRRRQGSKSLAK